MNFIDADSHVLAANIFDYVEDSTVKGHLPNYIFGIDGRLQPGSLEIDPNRSWNLNKLPLVGYNASGRTVISKRLEHMETMGVDFQILNPDEQTLRFSYLVEPMIAREIARSHNRSVLDIVKTHPDRFAATLLLPLQDMDWSLDEMRWGKSQGFKSIVIDVCWPVAGSITSQPLADIPRLDDLFALAVELDMLIVLHQQSHKREIRSESHVKRYRLEKLYPTNYEVALVSLVTSGLLDKHPTVRILMAEGEEDFLAITLRHLRLLGYADAAERLARNFLFTIETESTAMLMNNIRELGPDCFLFATDYPHNDPGGIGKWEDADNLRKLGLDALAMEKIGRTNTIKAFALTI